MPWPFPRMSLVVPATYFVNIARGVILRGAGRVPLDGLVLPGMGMGWGCCCWRRSGSGRRESPPSPRLGGDSQELPVERLVVGDDES